MAWLHHGLCARDLAAGTRVCQKFLMTKRMLVAFVPLAIPMFWVALGCASGGQTYDDGADGLDGRRIRLSPTTNITSEGDAAPGVIADTQESSSTTSTTDAVCEPGACSSATEALPACTELYADAYAAVDEMYDSVDRGCSTNDDCLLMSLRAVTCTPLYGNNCEVVVAMHVGELPRVYSTLDAIEERYCAEYEDSSCQLGPNDAIQCPDPVVFTARCMDSQCDVATDMFDAGPP